MPIGRRPDVSLMATPEQRFELRKRSIEIRNTKPIFIGDFGMMDLMSVDASVELDKLVIFI